MTAPLLHDVLVHTDDGPIAAELATIVAQEINFRLATVAEERGLPTQPSRRAITYGKAPR